MKTFIASTIVALSLVAAISGPAAASDFNVDTFFQQMQDNGR